MNRKSDPGRDAAGRRGRELVRRRRRSLWIEGLETRITPSTATWSGGGGDASWMNAGNWDVAPQPGDDLVFPDGLTNLQADNDFPVDTIFSSIDIEGAGYALSGAALGLTGGITATYSSGTSTD